MRRPPPFLLWGETMTIAQQPGQPMVASSTVPIPDPTLLTTQASEKAVSNLKELLQTQFGALKGIIDRQQTQLDTRDGDIRVAISHLRDLLMGEVSKLEAVTAQQFVRIDSTLAERATQGLQLAAANTKAIDTAFQSAEKAVSEQNKANTTAINKSETAVADSLKQLRDLFETANKGTNDKIDTNNTSIATQITDLKSRLDKGEGRSNGVLANVADTREVRRDSTNLWGIVAGALIAGISLLFVIIDKLHS